MDAVVVIVFTICSSSWLGRNNNDNALTKAEMTDYYINIVSAVRARERERERERCFI